MAIATQTEKVQIDGSMYREYPNAHVIKAHQAAAKRILDWRAEHEAIRYFKPNASQKPVMLSDAAVRVFAGPNRVGKTTLGVTEIAWHSMGIYPEWYPERLRVKPPIRVRIAGPDFQEWAQHTLNRKIEETIPKHWITRRRRNPQGVVVRYEFKTGTVWNVMTYEQKDQQFESADFDRAWFDEPPPQSKFIATFRGLVDRAGRMLMTMTPLIEGPWLEDLYEQAVDDPNMMWFPGDIEDNMDHLDRARYEQWKRMIPEHERAARLEGKIVTLRDRIWPQFSDEVHTCAPFKAPKDASWFRAIDTHPRQPDAITWAFCTSQDDIYIAQEAEIEGSVEIVADAIKQMTPVKPQWSVIDPNAARNPVEWGKEQTVQDKYLRAGVPTILVDDNWHLGKVKIDEFLAYEADPKDKSVRTPPKLHIFTSCPKTIRQVKKATYDPQSAQMREKRDPQSKPRQKDVHFVDNARYLLMADAHYWRHRNQSETYAYKPRSARAGY